MNLKPKNPFIQLVEALQTGWEIQEPILLGAVRDSETSNEQGVYHFVLCQEQNKHTALMSLPPSPQLLMFLANHRLQVRARF